MSFGAVAAIGGAVIGASASKSAAKSQSRAAAAATDAEREMFERQIEMQAPFRNAGVTANNRLMQLLGLGGSGGGSAKPVTAGSLINTDGNWTPNADLYGSDDTYRNAWDQFINYEAGKYGAHPNNALGSTMATGINELKRFGFDLDAYNKRIAAEAESAGVDPEYGSLMRDFSMADFEADPGYQFRVDEGMRGVEGSAAARGGLLSGAAQKAIQKYGQGMASQEYGNAFNRFTGQQTNKYNRLAGIVNTGQGATNQISNAAAQFGQSSANNIIGAGNAQAAGQIGQANAITGGINQGFNTYQNNQLMNMIRNPSAGDASWGNLNNQYFSGNQGMGG